MSLEQLLVIQQHDSAIDRLRHTRANLPHVRAIADCDDERVHLDAVRSGIAEHRHGLEREQRRVEDQVALIEERRSSESARLYSGTVTDHKDLQAIQAELDVLASRQSGLEDEVLGVMERIEPVDAELDATDAKLADVVERRDQAEADMDGVEAELDAEMSTESAARAAAAEGVEAALLAEYERARAASGGVGAARLKDKTCEGCHLQLSAIEVDRLRKEAADVLVWCPECRRILVR